MKKLIIGLKLVFKNWKMAYVDLGRGSQGGGEETEQPGATFY